MREPVEPVSMTSTRCLRLTRLVNKRADFFQAENYGFRFRLLGVGYSQGYDIQKSRALTAILKADHESFFFVNEVQLVGTNFLRSKQCGRFVKDRGRTW